MKQRAFSNSSFFKICATAPEWTPENIKKDICESISFLLTLSRVTYPHGTSNHSAHQPFHSANKVKIQQLDDRIAKTHTPDQAINLHARRAVESEKLQVGNCGYQSSFMLVRLADRLKKKPYLDQVTLAYCEHLPSTDFDHAIVDIQLKSSPDTEPDCIVIDTWDSVYYPQSEHSDRIHQLAIREGWEHVYQGKFDNTHTAGKDEFLSYIRWKTITGKEIQQLAKDYQSYKSTVFSRDT